MSGAVIERDSVIRADLAAGVPVARVASAHAVPVVVVERIATIAGLGGHAITALQHPHVAYTPSAEAAEVLAKIGWDIAAHLPLRPRCSTRDAAMCESLLLEDITFEVVGARAGVSRERARQVLLRHTGMTTKALAGYRADLREARRLVTGRAVAQRLIAEDAEVTLAGLAEASGLSVSEVAELLGPQEALRRRPRNTWTVGSSDEAVLAEMRRVASLPGGTPLSGTFYDARCGAGAVKAVRVIQRFGSWTQACERAGIPANARRRGYGRTWSPEQMYDWVSAYVADVGAMRATYAGFDAWARQRKAEGAPSAQTVRNTLGKWAEILEAVATRGTA